MSAQDRPVLRIVRGDATPEEVAALVAALSARAAAAAAAAGEGSRPRSLWADRSAMMRRSLPYGPGAWRASTLPR
ncbi:acyl-CoA carboxylase subunit epsilon [Thermomonospora catenispora]|uniref:acyl-CoA carboxylase subunit epsilon n=1 Tax=Thermomonospora catenispora TaxID=2493090 RepID=UPI001121C25F|nr:acyl-CoA carboxylase subunit epsilon [Thermomonospora catenispora]TNY38653.1 acyl-CoA carboxylase subunit epsilon [Thermomonospora catenispora]